MVWPCPLPVDAYAAAGRAVRFPRPGCPSCAGPLVLWSGYWRHVREAGRCRKIFVPRLRCGRCRVSHAGLPAFVLGWRLDVAEAVGAVIAEVVGGGCGVRPAAARWAVPYTTARGWVRRFRRRALVLGIGFAALGVELGAAAGLSGWLGLGVWRFACSVSGGRLIAANTTSPYLMVGKRRFMPPVPP
jgi:hypothetical protein